MKLCNFIENEIIIFTKYKIWAMENTLPVLYYIKYNICQKKTFFFLNPIFWKVKFFEKSNFLKSQIFWKVKISIISKVYAGQCFEKSKFFEKWKKIKSDNFWQIQNCRRVKCFEKSKFPIDPKMLSQTVRYRVKPM